MPAIVLYSHQWHWTHDAHGWVVRQHLWAQSWPASASGNTVIILAIFLMPLSMTLSVLSHRRCSGQETDHRLDSEHIPLTNAQVQLTAVTTWAIDASGRSKVSPTLTPEQASRVGTERHRGSQGCV